ncbi:3-hydroxybutyrate dehydrogenase [Neobacillus niacini]|uniref:3-hydroxybutyrate dehydrogenase n=1 Tax=Neobacillus niacini TaxID=86668 RepID=UPI0021CB47A2|nr:3-hydroxybutyrate dehydrogenase [Neobacillus niacini]MCM3768089.1 3-hydroxybutyrate dehydrogenase [Neobacillus niacini]
MEKKERIVIVTGAAQGIGFAIAKAFVENGDWVAIADIKVEAAEKAAAQLGNAKGYKVDLTLEEDIKRFVEQVVAEKGTVDVVVNNAGLQYISTVEDFPLDKWNQLLRVILTGTFLMTKYTLPIFKAKNKGRIINISSTHGQIADPFKSAYVAAKFGVEGFTKTVALENAQTGITANTIMPGPVRTQLIENQIAKLAAEDGTSEQEAMEKHILGKQPMKRLLEPFEVGATAVFLASEGANAITGTSLNVSGGMLA